MIIKLIAAYSKTNRVMGSHGKLPWRYVHDLQHFKREASGCVLVCGPKTLREVQFLKLPIVLWHRDVPFKNIIESAKTVALQCGLKDIAIVGGSKVFELGMEFADKLIITEIQKEYQGDIYFPEISTGCFKLISEYTHPQESDLLFKIYERINVSQEISTANNHS